MWRNSKCKLTKKNLIDTLEKHDSIDVSEMMEYML